MRAQTARPLRALAALMVIYVGGRIAMAVRYPEFAALGLQPGDGLLTAHTKPTRTAGSRPAATAVIAVDEAAGNFRSTPVERTLWPLPLRATAVGGAKRDKFVVPTPVRQAEMATVPPSAFRRAEPTRLSVDGAPLPPGSVVAQTSGVLRAMPANGAIPTLPGAQERGHALSGSAWLLVRDGSRGASLASGGTLGGSQAGVRVNWRPAATPVFLTVRASAALATQDSEIAPGIGVRGKLVGVILEQRFGLQRGRSSQTALVAYGGVDDIAAPLGFRVDGYAQAGAVGVSAPALFADGAARAERGVARLGHARLGVGAAVWGAAQPGVSRVDVGPQAVLHAPVGPAGVRLSAEYRFRIAGGAKPANGLSVTLGADF